MIARSTQEGRVIQGMLRRTAWTWGVRVGLRGSGLTLVEACRIVSQLEVGEVCNWTW